MKILFLKIKRVVQQQNNWIKLSQSVVALVVGISAIIAFLTALASLRWRYVHDSPLMIYAGFLVAHGYVPYRDFFDMNMPGTYFVMAAVGRIFGWDDLGFRIFDLLCLAYVSVFTFLWMRRIGKLPALTAPVAFSLWYLGSGPYQSLQREYLALVLFTTILAIGVFYTTLPLTIRLLLCGFISGLTTLIKPHFLLISLPLLIYIIKQNQSLINPLQQFTIFMIAAIFPICGMFSYLIITNAFKSFLDISLNYWPLYTHMTGDHIPINGLNRVIYIIKGMLKGLLSPYTLAAIVGLISLDNTKEYRHFFLLVVGLLIVTSLYPAITGQFWGYHWLPFKYVALCAASLAARPIKRRNLTTILFLIILLVLSLKTTYRTLWQWKDLNKLEIKEGVPYEVAQFLRSHLRPGDFVQPLDWTGGAVHGMLMARALLATRFMYDFHFYHHVSHPYIIKLRSEFIKELLIARPRFIIDVFGENKPWPKGPDTSRSFPELEEYLKKYYITVKRGKTYRILERKN